MISHPCLTIFWYKIPGIDYVRTLASPEGFFFGFILERRGIVTETKVYRLV